MAEDEEFSYIPEVEETYSEAETEEAMKFIKENELPMEDLLYALKYVRISNRVVEMDEIFDELRQRLKKLREEDIAVVTPPSDDEDNI